MMSLYDPLGQLQQAQPQQQHQVQDPQRTMEPDLDDSEMTFAEDHTDLYGDDSEEGGSTTHHHHGHHHRVQAAQVHRGSGSSATKTAARQRRGRGRALLGLNVVITNGRYKGETGLVVRGANGYYSVKFHRAISELRAHDNTAMKRSSELAPITPSGKRLQLPIPPAQRKLMKQQALQAVSTGGGLISVPSSATSSPRIRPVDSGSSSNTTQTTHSGKRKAGVSFSSSQASPRGDRRRRKKLGGGYTNEDDGSEGEDYAYGGGSGSGRMRSPSRSPSSSRSRSPDHDSHMYAPSASSGSDGEEDDESFDGPRLSHSRSHSSSSSRSSSPSRSSSLGSQSPTRTELLSPHLHAQYGSGSPQGTWSLTSALTSGSSSIPASPHFHNVMAGQGLPNMTLGPKASHEAANKVRVATMRVSSPEDAKTAATILLALSHEVGASPEGGVLISGGEIPPPLPPQHSAHRVEQHPQHVIVQTKIPAPSVTLSEIPPSHTHSIQQHHQSQPQHQQQQVKVQVKEEPTQSPNANTNYSLQPHIQSQQQQQAHMQQFQPQQQQHPAGFAQFAPHTQTPFNPNAFNWSHPGAGGHAQAFAQQQGAGAAAYYDKLRAEEAWRIAGWMR